MRIKDFDIDSLKNKYFEKRIFSHGYYFYDYDDQKNNYAYPEGIEKSDCRTHFLKRLNDDYEMYLTEVMLYVASKKMEKLNGNTLRRS